jgi:protein TonB
MLAYAVDRRPVGRANSPSLLVVILAGHAVLIGAVMASKTDLPERFQPPPTIVELIKDKPPPPPEDAARPQRRPTDSAIDTPVVIVPTDLPVLPAIDPGPVVDRPTPAVGPAVDPLPIADPPTPALVRRAARFITPADDIRPPYPEGKRLSQQEASLRLAWVINAAGRVTSVEPVGAVDPDVLAAARSHILKRWRYRPATEGGSPIESRTIVTLRFELEE